MSLRRLSILAVLLAFFAGSGSLLALAEAGEHVVTTDRLNLRTCPDTAGCSVVRTLPRGVHLDVIERQGNWLRVTSLESDETGWVSVRYTQVVESTSPRATLLSALLGRGILPKLFVALCGFLALVTMAWFGRKLQETATAGQHQRDATMGQLFGLSVLSVITGAVFLLNQFGQLVADFATPWLSLEGVSFLWKVNSVTEGKISYLGVVLFLGAVTLGVAAVAPGTNGGRLSFFQGVCTGFLALPLFTIGVGLAALVAYLVFFLFKAIGYVLGLIAIPLVWLFEHIVLPVLRFLAVPFVWLFEHIVLPVLRFIAIPFVWLWENFLREILLFLAIPFVWLWKVILQPLTGIVFKFIVKPILFLILGTAAALVCLFPFGVIGVVALESVRNSFRGSLGSHGLFAQGVTAGFLVLDATLLAALNGLGVPAAPPLSLAIPVALQLIVFLRLLAPKERAFGADAGPVFQEKLVTYWKSSRLEMVATCVMIPVGLLVVLAGASQDS
jgi:SH3 domain-containing protein